MKKIRIIYAEDHVQFRKAVISELEHCGIQVIAQAGNGKELIDQLPLKPQVVLLDLEMPVLNGNQTLDYLMTHHPETKVIIVSMHYEELLVENYLKRGARGYISKDAFSGSTELLADAIHQVAAGRIYVHHTPVKREKLSRRQKEMIPLMLEGYTNKEIAAEMDIGLRSVEKQRQQIYTKVGGDKALDFYKYAFSRGLQFLGVTRSQDHV